MTREDGTVRVGSADLSDVAAVITTVGPEIQAIWPGAYAAGSAFTVEIPPGDHRSVFEAIGLAERGSVLVIDAGGAADRAVFGEITALAAIQRGIAGVVIDGYVRDRDAIRELKFPVFARGAVPTAPRPREQGTLHGPVDIAGARIHDLDFVVADGDGVVAVAADSAETLLPRAVNLITRERQIASALRGGTPVSEFTAQLRALNEGHLEEPWAAHSRV